MSTIFNEYLIFRQENGPDVELVVNGDEFYARYETTEGYVVSADRLHGFGHIMGSGAMLVTSAEGRDTPYMHP